MQKVWAPRTAKVGAHTLTLRQAQAADIPTLTAWDKAEHVISATTDDPDAEDAFEGIVWPDEIANASLVTFYLLALLDGRPIGAMQVIDPHAEPTHYWGEIEPNLRALDIWIGSLDDIGKGYGEAMMALAIDACFEEARVNAIVIDPLASNTRAHKFYQRLGFKPLTRQLFNDEDDCLVHRLDRADWRARLGS
ncbi:MAG: GNAT family N-acetyltransferase [Hyphomonadaceae bacterium]